MASPQTSDDGWIDVPSPAGATAGVTPGGVRGAVSPTSDQDGWVDIPSPGAAANAGSSDDGWVDVPSPGASDTDKPDTHADVESISKTRDGGGTGIVYQSDLESLAQAHGVDASELKGWVGYLTGTLAPEAREGVEHVTEGVKSTVGVMSGGMPAGLAKKWLVDDESKRRALDDLASLIDKRKSGLTSVAEMASSVAAPAVGGVTRLASGASKAIRGAAAVGEAVGLGAGYGYAGSNEDNELQSTLMGAGVGGILGGAAAKLGARMESKAAQKLAAEAPEAMEAVEKGAEDAVSAASRAYEAAQDAEQALQQAVIHTPAIRESARSRDIVKFMDSTTPEQRRVLAQLADADTKLPKRAVSAYGEEGTRAWMLVRETTENFDRTINVGQRQGGIRDRIAGGDQKYIEDAYVRMRQTQYMDREIMKLPGSAAASMSLGGRVTRFMSDLRYVTNSIDRRLQIRITPDLDRLSASFNRMTKDLRASALLLRSLHEVLLAAERKPTLAGAKFDMYTALEEPAEALAKYTPAQQQAIKAWRFGWESLRELANKRGLPIAKLTDDAGNELAYVYHKAVDPIEFVKRMEQKGEELGVRLGRIVRDEHQDIPDEVLQKILTRAEAGDKPAVEFVSGLKLVSGSAVKNVTQARKAINEMSDTSRVGHNLETVAGAALERKGEIPEFLRERDVTKLFMAYANSTLRHAHLRGDLDAMRGWANAVERRDPISAEYIRRYVEDIVGVRAGSAAEMRGEAGARIQLFLMRKARRATRPAEKAFYTAAARLPDLLPRVSGNMYSYYLGAKLHKVAENLTSPFTVGIPSTGLHKSAGQWIAGTADVIKTFGRGPRGTKRMKEELIERGLMPADQPFEAHRWMREGLERSWFKRNGTAAMDGVNRLAMYMYQQSDAITRGITLQTSKRFAAGMRRGDPKAIEVIKHMDPGYQAEVRELLARGEDPTDSIARWLNGYTQFNYNRASMSEYGRFMGGLFSTFSKWPTSTFGEIAYRVEAAHDSGQWSPHMAKLAQKYFGPWIALFAVSRVIRDGITDGVDEQTLNPFSRGTPEWRDASPQLAQVLPDPGRLTPLGTLGGLVTSAPAPRGTYDVSKQILDGNLSGASMAALRAALPFTSGSVIGRFIVEDLPAWQGERPDGKVHDALLQGLGIKDE